MSTQELNAAFKGSIALEDEKRGLVVQPKVTSIVPAQSEWERKLALVKHTVAPGLTDDEFELFCHVAKTRNLDPLQRQIHAVKRRTWDSDTNGYIEKLTIQIGIDGFRAIANRTGLYMPSDKPPLIEDTDDQLKMRATVWVKKYHRESKTWNEFAATAYYREFVQVKKANNEYKPVAMWAKMPLSMTEKCAEAKALRRGWPEELGQIYIPEEMVEQTPTLEGESPKMDERLVSDYLASIDGAGDVDELQTRYFKARDAASAAKDQGADRVFAEAKNRMYKKLFRGNHA